jgi:hypothetical protein
VPVVYENWVLNHLYLKPESAKNKLKFITGCHRGSNSQYENHVEGRGMQNGMAMLSYAARCMKN